MSPAEQPGPRAPEVPHGTLRGYSLGCRCLFCRSAKTAITQTASDPVSDTTEARERPPGTGTSTVCR